MIRDFFGLLMLVLTASISLQAEMCSIDTAEHQLIHQIIKNQRYCVRAFEADRIFIRPENIVSTAQGLFLDVNGVELFPLPLLQPSKNGHFLQVDFTNGVELAAKNKSKGPCPGCDVDTDGNGICQNEECPLRGFKVRY